MSESFIYPLKDSKSFDALPAREPTCVFVTGGTGLVGSHLIDNLCARGKHVRASFRKSVPDIKNKEKVEWVKGDILDLIFLEEALKDVEQLYHCAGIVSFNPMQKDEMFAANVAGTVNVVNASINAGVKKLCFV